jgi:UPF0716 protein FxsA
LIGLTLLLLFTVVPAVELWLLFQVGHTLGAEATVAMIVVTGMVGAALARHQGLASLQRMNQALSAGQPPTGELLEGALILVAGVLLVTPGVLTDAVGFALLVPPLRRLAGGGVKRWARGRVQMVDLSQGLSGNPFGPQPHQPGGVKRVEATVRDVEPRQPSGDS